jgi:LAO/AO transport system kinase
VTASMHPLVPRILQGDKRAVARALSLIENDAPDKRALLQGLYPYSGRAHVVGITGAPGAGKSTLVDGVIRHLRQGERTVGVLAVDPSSPFTGGALLGDRVRMTEHSADPGVYIRSMGSRGGLGGLADCTREMLYPLDSFGCDVVLLETVGVGQAELDVMTVADTVVLVLTPGSGDDVQAAKAGIMEIADVFVVNKRELPGADTLLRELRQMLRERSHLRNDWLPPVVAASAATGEGIADVWAAIASHREHMRSGGHWLARRRERHRAQALRLVETRFRRYLEQRAATDPEWQRLLEGDLAQDPYQTADELLKNFPWLHV